MKQGQGSLTQHRIGHLAAGSLQPASCSLQPVACSLVNRRGQHMAEYALALAVATAAIAGMSTYVRRALQSRVKATTDFFLAVEESDRGAVVAQRPLKGDFNGNGEITDDEIARVDNFIQGKLGCSTMACPSDGGPCVMINRSPCPETLSAEEQLLADINGDGRLSQRDVELMFALRRGNYTIDDLYGGIGTISFDDVANINRFWRDGVSLSEEEVARADLDHNGRIDAADALSAVRIALFHDDWTWLWPESPWLRDVSQPYRDRGAGDFNHDGNVTPDEVDVARAAVRHPGALVPEQRRIADADEDGLITWTDVWLIYDLAWYDLDGARAPRLGPPPVEPHQAGEETQRLGILYERFSETSPGDLNGDGQVTNDEIIKVTNYALGDGELTDREFDAADIDGSGSITVDDLVSMVNFALGKGLGPAIAPGSSTTTSTRSRMSETGSLSNGDLNGDGQVTNDEIIRVVNHVLGAGTLSQAELLVADVDGRDGVTVADVWAMVNIALGQRGASDVVANRIVRVEKRRRTTSHGQSRYRGRLDLPVPWVPPQSLTERR